MTRDVYLIIYKSRLYASHWAVFVPNANGHHDDGMKAGPGKVINVEGDVNNGFDLLFKRNYDPSECTRGKKLQFLASIDDSFVSDPTDSVTVIEDDLEALPGDKLEQIAQSVPAPSKTLGVKDEAGKPVPRRNCQSWTKDFVVALAAAQIMPAEVPSILDNLPEVD